MSHLENSVSHAGARRISQVASDGPFGKSKLYEEIRAGRLKARKAGGATLILDEDWAEFLKSLPAIEPHEAEAK